MDYEEFDEMDGCYELRDGTFNEYEDEEYSLGGGGLFDGQPFFRTVTSSSLRDLAFDNVSGLSDVTIPHSYYPSMFSHVVNCCCFVSPEGKHHPSEVRTEVDCDLAQCVWTALASCSIERNYAFRSISDSP